MNKEKAEKHSETQDINHGRRVMITTEGPWIVWRFEFDAEEGVVWHQGRGMGGSNSVKNSTRHFIEKGYTVVAWEDV